jgi:Protein of unknown function (DUF1488)
MPDISFPPGEHWDGRREVVVFQANTGTESVPCAISFEALQDRFNGDSRQPLETFRQHRSAIEALARTRIRQRRFEPDGSIVIRARDT